jgi:hypothetical protein
VVPEDGCGRGSRRRDVEEVPEDDLESIVGVVEILSVFFVSFPLYVSLEFMGVAGELLACFCLTITEAPLLIGRGLPKEFSVEEEVCARLLRTMTRTSGPLTSFWDGLKDLFLGTFSNPSLSSELLSSVC